MVWTTTLKRPFPESSSTCSEERALRELRLTFTKVDNADGTSYYYYDPAGTVTEVESDSEGNVKVYGLKGL